MYYNDYIDDYMVLSSYETNDGVSLINLLVPHIEGDDPANGSNTAEVVSGLNWYLRWKGRAGNYVATSSASIYYSTYMSIIDSGRPAIIDLNSPLCKRKTGKGLSAVLHLFPHLKAKL